MFNLSIHVLTISENRPFLGMFVKFLIKFGLFVTIMSGMIFYGIYYLNSLDKFLFYIILLITVFGFGISTIFLVRSVFLEIKKFTINTNKISNDSDVLLKINNNSELGQLGNSINRLSQKFIKKSKNYEEKIVELQIIENELKYKVQYLDDIQKELSESIHMLTEQKKIEKKHIQELEWRSKIVKSLVEEAKLADQRKSEFTSMISHELKTPLTSIISWCSILEQNAYGVLNPKQLRSVQKIHENADKLVLMIGDLLDIKKLDLGKMAFTFSDLSSRKIVQSVYEEFETIAKEKNIDFSISCKEDFLLSGDEIRIEQVLKNFLTNAIDFVHEKGKIEIVTKRNDPYVTFCVKDDGIGISKENQKKLFKQFYQVNASATREHGGSGLGLTICKGIVHSMNGLIGVESELEKGSTFYFSLPIKNVIVPDFHSIIGR